MTDQKRAPSRRPALTDKLSVEQFRSWYWLKDELLDFCRSNLLPVSGQKAELADRVGHYLKCREVLTPSVRRTRHGAMPEEFTLQTIIGQGWRCNPRLRAFFREHCGRGFRFNAPVRAFIHDEVGMTLTDAIDCYKRSVDPANSERPMVSIAPTFEYNQHMRLFFEQNPGATRQQAIDAWWKKRGRRKRPVR